jgi:ABC-type dipeptide/oligopeptide/nickel transport system permease component
MLAYLARRSSYMLLILVLSSIGVFYSLRFAPGDPSGVALNPLTIKSIRAEYRKKLGLDQPTWKQYVIYIKHVSEGDLGHSLVSGASVVGLLETHGKRSLVLGFTALAISYLLAIPLGVLAAVKRNTWIDQAVMGTAVLGMAVPNFWLALLLIWGLSLDLHWLPSSGVGAKELILPALVLAAEGTAVLMRMVRASMLEQLNQDFVRTLRAKGLPERLVVGRHVLRNALIPVISLSGLRLGQIVGYTFIVEVIFHWPGVGYLLVDSVIRRDYPVAQFFSLLLVFFVIFANLLADVGYGLANPRIRRG